MDCVVCMERFDATERRPKALPCGHSFCLECVRQLAAKACPLDKKPFPQEPNELADNYGLLEAVTCAAKAATRRFWCLSCEEEATEDCVAGHLVTSLKKARVEEAGHALQGLTQTVGVLDTLGKTLDGARQEHNAFRKYVNRTKKRLNEAELRLQREQDQDQTTWDQAKLAAARNGAVVPSCMARLVEDLADPSAACSVEVRLGAGGQAKWRTEVAPAEDPLARLLLCRLAAKERVQEQRGESAAPRWQERGNEAESDREMAAMIEVGCRVARGRDWLPTCAHDGTPPGPGTVVANEDAVVRVRWDRTGLVHQHFKANREKIYLRLLARPPLPDLLDGPESDSFIKFQTPKSCEDLNSMTEMLSDGRLARVRHLAKLPCTSYGPWSQKVLEQVAPHLEGLQMVSPLQRHMDVVVTMPHLQALSLTNVTGEQLQQVSEVASLRRLELHCPLDAPLPVPALAASTANTARLRWLRWLRCGVYPLAAALALARDHAETLEELQLVAASTDPYGCPDLARELQSCGLKQLKSLVLLRDTAYGAACRHDRESCALQAQQIWNSLSENVFVRISCTVCDHVKVAV